MILKHRPARLHTSAPVPGTPDRTLPPHTARRRTKTTAQVLHKDAGLPAYLTAALFYGAAVTRGNYANFVPRSLPPTAPELSDAVRRSGRESERK